jgi:4-amino-4-deoxy-L-arabinose transferase-like glycosyltransferase
MTEAKSKLKFNIIRVDGKTHTLLILIIMAGFFARVLVARYEWLNMDEGSYLNDANLVLSGAIPIKDFFSREPLFIFLLSFFYGYFGRTLFAGRLLSVFAGTIIIWALYEIGVQLSNKKVGMLAAAIYALSPYTVDWGAIIKTEVVSSMFVSLSVLTLVKSINNKDGPKILLFICGVLLGVSVLIRRNAVVSLLIPLATLMYEHREFKKPFFFELFLILSGFTISSGIPLVYLIGVTDFRWVWQLLGLGELLHPQQLVVIRMVVSWSALMMLFYMIIPSIIFLLNSLSNILSHLKKTFSKSLCTFVASLICLLFFGVSVSGTFAMNFLHIYGYGIFYVPYEINLAFIALMSLALSLFITIWTTINTNSRLSVTEVLVSGWLFSYLLFYSFYPSLFVDYFNDFTPALSLATAFGIFSIHSRCTQMNVSNHKIIFAKRKPSHLRHYIALFYMLLLSTGIIVSFFAMGPGNPYNRNNIQVYDVEPYNFWDRSWDPSFVQTVANYIASITDNNEEIFTADTAFVSLAQRRVLCNISYPHHYLWGRKEPVTYDPYSLTCSINEIIERMEQKQVKLVVVGARTLEMFRIHPELERYIQLRYTLSKVFGDPARIDAVKIYTREPYSEKIEFYDDFSIITERWIFITGDWDAIDGVLNSSWKSHFRAMALLNMKLPDSLLIETDLQVTGEGGVVLRYKNQSNYYLVRLIRSPDLVGLQITKVINGTEFEIKSKTMEIIKDKWYHLKIIAIKGIFFIYVDSTLQITACDETFQSGMIGLSANYGAEFDNLYITNNYQELVYG